MPKRANGEGSIAHREDGRWQAAIMLNGRRVTVYGRTKTEVSEKLNQLRDTTRTTGGLPNTGRLTVAEYIATWLEDMANRLRPTTLATYTTMLNLYILPSLGNAQLKKLTAFGLSRHFTLIAKECGAPTVQKCRMVFNKALTDAVKLNLISANPLANVTPPKSEPKPKSLWTLDQATAFIESMRNGLGGHYANLWLFLLASGCRLGEALALTRKDVDFNTGAVRIERSATHVNGKLAEGPPKTKAGRRSMALPTWCIEALQAQIVQRMWCGGDKLFTTSTGKTPQRRNLLREFHASCRRTGLPPITIHSLRHLNCSLMAANGVPVKAAMERLGHSTPSITLGIYTHVLGVADRQAANALESLGESR